MNGQQGPGAVRSLATDPVWLKEALSLAMRQRDAESAATLSRIHIRHIWNGKKQKTVLYDVHFSVQEGVYEQLYVGHVVASEKFVREFDALAKQARTKPPHGPAIVALPEANLILLAYPNDPKMQLISADDLLPWARRNAGKFANGKMNGRPPKIDSTRLEILQYVPGKRFTARCRIGVSDGAGHAEEYSIVAKQLKNTQKSKMLYRNLRTLEKALRRIDNDGNGEAAMPVHIPHALGMHKSKPVVFIDYLPGQDLLQLLPELDLAKTMPAVGELLARFHLAEKRVRKTISCRIEIDEVRIARRTITAAFPGLKKRLHLFCKDFRELIWEDGAGKVLLHGSFRLNHIFLHSERLSFLDLDSLRMGHPAYDIGNFLASLHYLEAQEKITGESRQAIQEHFLRGYANRTPYRISPRAVLWFLSSLLVNKQAYKYVTHSHPDRHEKVLRMLALAERLLAAGRQVPQSTPLAALPEYLENPERAA